MSELVVLHHLFSTRLYDSFVTHFSLGLLGQSSPSVVSSTRCLFWLEKAEDEPQPPPRCVLWVTHFFLIHLSAWCTMASCHSARSPAGGAVHSSSCFWTMRPSSVTLLIGVWLMAEREAGAKLRRPSWDLFFNPFHQFELWHFVLSPSLGLV